MPKLPVVRSRQSSVSGQPSQVAGALIPDNTQHSWRDDVGKDRLGFNDARQLSRQTLLDCDGYRHPLAKRGKLATATA